MDVQNSDNALFLNERRPAVLRPAFGPLVQICFARRTLEFVPYKTLPHDFAMIPPTHPKSQRARLRPRYSTSKRSRHRNSIPQTATVQRREAKLDLTYDGAPAFKTHYRYAPLQYA